MCNSFVLSGIDWIFTNILCSIIYVYPLGGVAGVACSAGVPGLARAAPVSARAGGVAPPRLHVGVVRTALSLSVRVHHCTDTAEEIRVDKFTRALFIICILNDISNKLACLVRVPYFKRENRQFLVRQSVCMSSIKTNSIHLVDLQLWYWEKRTYIINKHKYITENTCHIFKLYTFPKLIARLLISLGQ